MARPYDDYINLRSPFTEDYSLASMFAEETEKSSQEQLYHLISVGLVEAQIESENFNIVDGNFPVTFKGITYRAFPCKYDPAEKNSDESVSKATITVANVMRELMHYVELYDGLKNVRVRIKTVYANALDEIYEPQSDGSVEAIPNPEADPNAYIEDEYFIDTYTADEQVITFQLDPIIDLDIKIPRRRYLVDGCYWKYKDSETCQSTGRTSKFAFITAGSPQLIVEAPYFTLPQGTKIRIDQELMSGVVSSPEYEVERTVAAGGLAGHLLLTTTPNISMRGLLYLPTCQKTLAECRLRDNEKNFGGFPGISGSRRILL